MYSRERSRSSSPRRDEERTRNRSRERKEIAKDIHLSTERKRIAPSERSERKRITPSEQYMLPLEEPETKAVDTVDSVDAVDAVDSVDAVDAVDILTEMINKPFTFGVEYEPTTLQYYDHDGGYHYDREVIKQDGKLKVTIEEFDLDLFYKDSLDEYKRLACEYNLEIAIGHFEYNTMAEFLNNKIKYMDEFIDNLKKFDRYIKEDNNAYLEMIELMEFAHDSGMEININRNVGNFRKFVIGGSVEDNNKNFRNCARTIGIDDKTYNKYKIAYTPFSREIITGKPQITIGMSYLFLPSVIFSSYDTDIKESTYNKIFQFISGKFSKQQKKLSIIPSMILDGFLFIIIYIAYLTTIYVSKKAGGVMSYLKASVRVKPRTNLALSYRYLVEDYPELNGSVDILSNIFRKSIDDLRQLLSNTYKIEIPVFEYNGIIGSLEGDKKPSITNFYRYKLNVFNTIAYNEEKLREIIRESQSRDYNCKQEDIEMFQTEFIINNFKPVLLVRYFTILKAGMMLYDIINPVPVIRIYIPDKTNIKKGCYVLDRYIYSYIPGPDRELVDNLLSHGLIEKEGEYLYSGQPPVLELEEGKLCCNFREELFEWIPDNSNVIVELRNAAMFTRNPEYKKASIKISHLPKFVSNVLIDLAHTFNQLITYITRG